MPVIAVVDDDTTTCDLISEILTDEGYVVVRASTGSDAITLVHQHMPSVLLLDMHLEGSIPGLSVVELLRASPTTAELPIIVSTADSYLLSEKAATLQALHCDVLAKPFEIDELLDRVAHALAPSSLELSA